jgi:hypothetical protein
MDNSAHEDVLGLDCLEFLMNETLGYRAAMLLSCVALALFAGNMLLASGNARRNQEIAERQTVIERGAAIERLTLKIAQNLNDIGNRYDDRQLCTMLRAESMPVKGKCGMLDGTDDTPGHAPHR